MLKITNKFYLFWKMSFTKDVLNQGYKNLNSNEWTKTRLKLCWKLWTLDLKTITNYFCMFYLILMVRPERGTVKGVVWIVFHKFLVFNKLHIKILQAIHHFFSQQFPFGITGKHELKMYWFKTKINEPWRYEILPRQPTYVKSFYFLFFVMSSNPYLKYLSGYGKWKTHKFFIQARHCVLQRMKRSSSKI